MEDYATCCGSDIKVKSGPALRWPAAGVPMETVITRLHFPSFRGAHLRQPVSTVDDLVSSCQYSRVTWL